MSFRSPEAAAVPGRRAKDAVSLAAGLTLLFTPLAAVAEEEVGREAVGAWHGNFKLDRDDPRIHTRSGADMLRIQVIHSMGAPVATISWVAGRGICEDPTAEPCEWIGAGGTVSGRVLQKDLVFAIPLSADAEDPLIVILRHGSGPRARHGQAMNSKADFGFDFSYFAAPDSR